MPIGNGYVGMAKEAAFGTVTAPTVFIPVKSAEGKTDPQNYYPEEIRGSRSKSKVVPMGRKNTLDISLDAESTYAGHFLLAVLGTVNTTSLAGVPEAFQHVFTGANTLPSFTVEKYDTVMTQRISGAKCDSLKLSVESGGDGVLTLESSWIAQSLADQAAASTPNYSDQIPFSFTSVTVTKGGSANSNVKKFEIEIKNNLKDDHYTLRTSRDVQEIPEGMREVTGSVDMFFKTKQDYLDFMNGSTDDLVIEFTGAVISDPNSESFKVELPKIAYDSFEIPMGGPDDEIMASLAFTALYDSASAFDIKVTLVSATSAY